MDQLNIRLECRLCRAEALVASVQEALSVGWTWVAANPEEGSSSYRGLCPACKGRTVRLACTNCDRDDFDGISQEQLEQAIRNGWQDVTEAQSYEESLREVPLGARNRSVFDWWTHVGTCPDCA